MKDNQAKTNNRTDAAQVWLDSLPPKERSDILGMVDALSMLTSKRRSEVLDMVCAIVSHPEHEQGKELGKMLREIADETRRAVRDLVEKNGSKHD